MAEEKEVAQIGAKVKEAKATKSFRIYQILASIVSEETLPKLTAPLREVRFSRLFSPFGGLAPIYLRRKCTTSRVLQ